MDEKDDVKVRTVIVVVPLHQLMHLYLASLRRLRVRRRLDLRKGRRESMSSFRYVYFERIYALLRRSNYIYIQSDDEEDEKPVVKDVKPLSSKSKQLSSSKAATKAAQKPSSSKVAASPSKKQKVGGVVVDGESDEDRALRERIQRMEREAEELKKVLAQRVLKGSKEKKAEAEQAERDRKMAEWKKQKEREEREWKE